MGIRDRSDRFIAQKLRCMAPASQGIPALDHDAFFLDERNDILFLIIRMDLVLYQSRRDRDLGQETVKFLYIPVGKTQGPDLSLLHVGLHGFVCFHIVLSGMVEKHHVNVADVQLFQRHVDCGFRIGKLVRIKLCDHEDILTGDAVFLHGLPDPFPDGLLIVVHIGCIDEPAAVFEQGFHRIHACIVVESIGSETYNRHCIAAVQENRSAVKIKFTHPVISCFRIPFKNLIPGIGFI